MDFGWLSEYQSAEDAFWGPTLNWVVTLDEDNRELSRFAYYTYEEGVAVGVEFTFVDQKYHPGYDLQDMWNDWNYGQIHGEPKDVSFMLFEHHESVQAFVEYEVLARVGSQ